MGSCVFLKNIYLPIHPSDIPDLRIKLIESWDTKFWRLYTRLYTNEMTKTTMLNNLFDTQVVKWHQQALSNASLYYVTDEMCELIYNTVPYIPDNTDIESLSIPSEYGLVVFAKPFYGIDSVTKNKKEVEVDAILWGPAITQDLQCITISSFHCLDKEKSQTTKLSRLDLQKAGFLEDACVLKDKIWIPLGYSDWPLSYPIFEPTNNNLDDQNESGVEDRRLLAALFTILDSKKIIEPNSYYYVDRATRRRNSKKQIKAPSNIRLVTLKQSVVENAEVENVETENKNHIEYSHRFMVRMHPVLQPCGAGGKDRKLIVRGPYIKGPEDKPLIIKETVNILKK